MDCRAITAWAAKLSYGFQETTHRSDPLLCRKVSRCWSIGILLQPQPSFWNEIPHLQPSFNVEKGRGELQFFE